MRCNRVPLAHLALLSEHARCAQVDHNPDTLAVLTAIEARELELAMATIQATAPDR